MSAASIIQKAREDGLSLAATERGTIKVIGRRGVAERWAPELAANKPAILAELRQAESADMPPKHTPGLLGPPGLPGPPGPPEPRCERTSLRFG